MNRDVYVAIALLVICGVFFWASFDIRSPDYGTLPPSAWPRVIILVLAVLSGIYLIQSLRNGPDEQDDSEKDDRPPPTTFGEWIWYWRNIFWCFGLFFLYLFALPYLGMLTAGTLFVFLLLCALGGLTLKNTLVHAAIAVIAVGGMWSIFTYGLGVRLPRGDLTGLF